MIPAVATVLTGLAIILAFVSTSTTVDEAGIRAAVRVTARLGAVWLCIVFATSGLHSLLRTKWTAWLLAHRRGMGLGFAVVYTGHAAMFLWLFYAYPESFQFTKALTTVVGGSIGYVFLYAMSITSFDGPAATMGRRRWKILHTTGIYLLWGIFAFSYWPRMGANSVYAVMSAVVFGAWAIRIAAFIRHRIRRAARRSAPSQVGARS